MSAIEKLWIEYLLTGFAVQRVRWDEPTQEAQRCDYPLPQTVQLPMYLWNPPQLCPKPLGHDAPHGPEGEAKP